MRNRLGKIVGTPVYKSMKVLAIANYSAYGMF